MWLRIVNHMTRIKFKEGWRQFGYQRKQKAVGVVLHDFSDEAVPLYDFLDVYGSSLGLDTHAFYVVFSCVNGRVKYGKSANVYRRMRDYLRPWPDCKLLYLRAFVGSTVVKKRMEQAKSDVTREGIMEDNVKSVLKKAGITIDSALGEEYLYIEYADILAKIVRESSTLLADEVGELLDVRHTGRAVKSKHDSLKGMD